MSKSENSWWSELTTTRLTACEQNIPRMITELCTLMHECPYTQPQTRAVISTLLEGSLRHGYWAGWRAHARQETLFIPYMELPSDLRSLPRKVWLIGARAVQDAYRAGVVNTPEGRALELVLGALGAIQGHLDLRPLAESLPPAQPSGK